MFKYRLISFPVLLALVAACFFWPCGGCWLFAASAAVLVGLALWEAGKLCTAAGFPVASKLLGVFSGIVVLLAALQLDVLETPAAIVLALIPVLPGVALLVRKPAGFKALLGAFGVFSSLGISFLMLVTFYSSGKGFANDLLYLILVTKAMDTGGYIFGRLSAFLPGGNHKIVPAVSPNKSWEGTIGGLIFSVCVSMLFMRSEIFAIPNWGYVVLGALFGLLSFAGDLTESALKRQVQVKDSGKYIPGMGGVLDVFDSFIYTGPVAALLAVLW